MTDPIQIGGVYSIVRGGGTFGVVKVIATQLEEDTVYTRPFSARSQERPSLDWFEHREPGALDRELGVGIGALPVTRRVFEFWEPVLLFMQDVTEAERADLRYCFGEAVPWDNLVYA